MRTLIEASLLLAVLALGLGGCTAEPRYPITQSPPGGGFGAARPRYDVAPPPAAPAPPAPVAAAPPPPPPTDEEGLRARPSHAVDSAPLPPVGGVQAPARAPPVTLQEWSRPSEPPPPGTLEVQVQPFETLYDVAERTHVPIRALIALNDLKPPYALTAGAVLLAPAPVSYAVAEGDTLFGIARRFDVDPRALSSLNGLSLEDRLKPGRLLALPPGVEDHGVSVSAKGARPRAVAQARAGEVRPPEPAHEPRGTPEAPSRSAALDAQPPRPAAPSPPEGEIIALGRGKFVWPVRGEILSTFGPKGPGQRNDGVNIAADPGASVRAAAAGVVVYAGNSIPAFGNLVLVKHPGGWATLYGNLGKITVANNAEVAQGQVLGSAGLSGAVDRPQVHFEIRYAPDPREKAKPLDPVSVLPEG
jgi:murein DD-endopeptidase MepM/ murein hydrolase activator NlpD